MEWLARGVASALLPSPERERVATPAAVSPPHWSFLAGLVGGAVGLLLYFDGSLAFMGDLGGRQAMALLQSGEPITDTDIRFGGILTWFAWHLQPQAWLYMYLSLTGLLRVVAFLATQEAVAEPVIWASMRLLENSRRKAEQQRRLLELGPRRPDRVLEEDGCDLVVLSCREKADWDESATIEIGARQYRLIDAGDRDDGRWKAIAYRLRESRSGDAVRRVVRTGLDPPEGHLGGALRAPKGRLWYFAFGLSLSPAIMEDVVDATRSVCTARLSRYALRFARPAGDGRGEAAVVPTGNPSDIVWGIVWECAEDNADALARHERIGEQCAWEVVEVRGDDAARYAVRVAVVNEDVRDLSLLPSRGYRDRLLEAARAHPFAKIYVGLIGSSPTR